MSQQGNKSLAKLGYIFGLGAFRRYEQHFGATISHFDETFKPTEEAWTGAVEALRADAEAKGKEFAQPLPPSFRTISDVEVNHRWAVMLKYAHDVWLIENEGEPVTIDEVEMLIDAAPQSDWDAIREQYLDSSYLGQKLRAYYGIPEPDAAKAKKKASPSAKQSPRRTSSATSRKK